MAEEASAKRAELAQFGSKLLKILKNLDLSARGYVIGRTRAVTPVFFKFYKGLVSLRRAWLLLLELAGVVLVTLGISLWSIPAALIVGGLVLVAAFELKPDTGPKMPRLSLPEAKLREQAQWAAQLINAERYGVGQVDQDQLDKLTPAECEQLIVVARSLGAKNL